jgi:tetratricopeptide (TPR) repeat protein
LSAFQRDRARKQHRKAAGPILDQAQVSSGGCCPGGAGALPAGARKSSRHFDALHLLGLSKSDVGEFQEAEANLQRALRVDPKSAELLSNLGMVQADMGQFEKARASYQSDCPSPEFSGRAQQSRQCVVQAESSRTCNPDLRSGPGAQA